MNINSMLYWFPKVKDLGLNIPKTEFVPLNLEKSYGAVSCSWDADEVHEAIQKVGGYPAFVRTDLASNKHRMGTASRIPSFTKLNGHVLNVIEYNECCGWCGLDFECLVVREWLELEHKFKAFTETPIAQEIRFFIKDGQVMCHHFYWPEDAIRFFTTDEKDGWENLLRETRDEALSEVNNILPDVQKVADVMEGYWSVDFAKAVDGKWYLIDMANGYESWHPEDCEKLKEMMRS